MRRKSLHCGGMLTLVASIGVIALVVALATPASAGTGATTCRASVVRVQGKGLLSSVFLEPMVVQNQTGQPCTAMSDEVVDLTVPFGIGRVRILRGFTSTSGLGNHPTATAEVTDLTISAPGVPVIQATVLKATASEQTCSGPQRFVGSSQVLGLRIGGVPVSVGGAPTTLNLGVATLYLNRTMASPTGLTQRALELNTLLANVVVSEAAVGHPTVNTCS